MAEEQQQGLQTPRISQQGRLRASIAQQWRRKRALDKVSSSGHALQRLAKDLRRDGEIVQAAVSENGMALKWAAKALRSDRKIVLAAVSKSRSCGYALEWAAETLKSDRDIVLAAVSTFGYALQWAAEVLRRDREIILVAVSNCGEALEFAERQLQCDREVVLAAVSQSGFALEFASSDLKRDREIVLMAASGGHAGHTGLHYADDSLLEDDSFAVEARQSYYSFRVVTFSGHTCLVLVDWSMVEAIGTRDTYQHLLRQAGRKLGMDLLWPDVTLLFGAEEVSWNNEVKDWPGSPALGAIVEYQLVKSEREGSD